MYTKWDIFSLQTSKKKITKNKDMKGGLRNIFFNVFTFYFNNVILQKI